MLRLSLSLLVLVSMLGCAGSDTEADPSKPEAGKSGADKAGANEPAPEPATPEPATPEPARDGPPPGVKTKGNLPVMTEAELAAQDAARDTCMTDCFETHKAEARSPEDIEAGCREDCMAKIPVVQVEVVPSPEPAP